MLIYLKYIIYTIIIVMSFSTSLFSSQSSSVKVTGTIERDREAGMFFYSLNSGNDGKIFLGAEHEFSDDPNKSCIMDAFENDKNITLEGVLTKDENNISFLDNKFYCVNNSNNVNNNSGLGEAPTIVNNGSVSEDLIKEKLNRDNNNKKSNINNTKQSYAQISLFGINLSMPLDEVVAIGLRKGYIIETTSIPSGLPYTVMNRIVKLQGRIISLNIDEELPYTEMNASSLNNIKLFYETAKNLNNNTYFDVLSFNKNSTRLLYMYFQTIDLHTEMVMFDTGNLDTDSYKDVYPSLIKKYGEPEKREVNGKTEYIFKSGDDVLLLYGTNNNITGPILAYSISAINRYINYIDKLIGNKN